MRDRTVRHGERRARNVAVAAMMAGLIAAVPGLAFGQAAPVPRAGELCLPAIASAETESRLPAGLLRGIARVESSRPDPATGRNVPWPWTINAAGSGAFFETKEAAIAAVRQLLANGVRSIDVGCAQVNLMHHPDAFASLEDAFDPARNASYAGRFLASLRASTGSWPAAAAGYHSLTPERGQAYALRVMAAWPDAARFGPWPEPRLATAPRPTVTDLSAFTPAFAARVRRMDEDRARLLGPAARQTPRPAAPVMAQRGLRRTA